MNSRAFLACLFAGAMSIFALAAGKPPGPAKSDHPKQNENREKKRLLTTLAERCRTMIDMQSVVHKGTCDLHKMIESNTDKKPRSEDKQAALKLAEKEKAIVAQVTKVIHALNAEGSAVAFPEVFEQLHKDMKEVRRRLEIGDVGMVTQAIEQDIIDSLKDMIRPPH